MNDLFWLTVPVGMIISLPKVLQKIYIYLIWRYKISNYLINFKNFCSESELFFVVLILIFAIQSITLKNIKIRQSTWRLLHNISTIFYVVNLFLDSIQFSYIYQITIVFLQVAKILMSTNSILLYVVIITLCEVVLIR